MISDNELYSLAIFLGSVSMLLIVLYHFLEVNAQDDTPEKTGTNEKASAIASQQGGAKVGMR